jgi:transcriptional regulator with XRE-family HTH domain
MSKPKINIRKLDQMLRAGKSQREIAKYFDVTPGAVSQAKRQLKNNIVRVVALEKANDVVESHLDIMRQLRKINNAINDELDKAKETAATADGKYKLALQQIIIKLSAEIRRQLEAQLKILEVWRDMKVNLEFQTELLAFLDGMQPGARDEIIQRLKERGTLRGTLSFT